MKPIRKFDPKQKPIKRLIPDCTVGSRIKFKEEKQKYTVVARTDRYLICTKPFNPKKTYLYTIVDLMDQVRGPDNFIFGFGWGYDDQESLDMAVDALEHGELYPSYKRSIPLEIEHID